MQNGQSSVKFLTLLYFTLDRAPCPMYTSTGCVYRGFCPDFGGRGIFMRSLRTLACVLAFAVAGLPQTNIGSITGTILDPAGAVVPGAKIEVKNSDTGAVYQGGASATGNYVIPVPVGKYSLAVTATGFKKYVRENLVVTVATDVRQDVNLEVGANTETVTVTADAPLLKTESGEISQSVTSNEADDLPVL